MPQKINSYQ